MEIQWDNKLKIKLLEICEKVKIKYNDKKCFDKNYSALRIRSIDFLRGIIVILTIFIICQGLEEYVDSKYIVSTWNGMVLADIILPFFLMIMGMSVPFYVKKYHKDGRLVSEISKKSIIRSITILSIGLIFSIIFMPSKGIVRLTGSYQLIAINYLICTQIYLGFLKLKVKNNALTYIFIGIGTIIATIFTIAAFNKGFKIENSVFYGFDQNILKGFASKRAVDPEGILACFSSISLTMYGLAIGCILNKKPIENKKYIRYKRTHSVRTNGISKENIIIDLKNFFNIKSIKSLLSNYYRFNNEAKKIVNMLMVGVTLYITSKILGIWIPLNRNVFSITFVLRMASYMIFLENIAYILFDIVKIEFATFLVRRIGQNALPVILVVSIVHKLFNLIKIKSIYTGTWLCFNNWLTTDFILPISGIEKASSTYALVMTIIWVLFLNLLDKYDVRINV